jgi:hypothetical protein
MSAMSMMILGVSAPCIIGIVQRPDEAGEAKIRELSIY